ncbi:hypothetical protein CERZMDRAFT_4157, partial [Cercospora zeae-maydis SCOH1-5]
PTVRVGVGVFIISRTSSPSPTNPTILLGLRKNSHGSGTFALPGGHLEFNESFTACAQREVLEETGLVVTTPKFLTATNDIMESENKHYVTIFMCCVRADETQEARNLEQEKCGGWEWVSWEEMKRGWEEEGGDGKDGVKRKKLFTPLVNLIRHRPDVVP